MRERDLCGRPAVLSCSDDGSNGGKEDAASHKVSNNNTVADLLRSRSPNSAVSGGKDSAGSALPPPPLGLAGLEAFRREYLSTSPLSHLRGVAAAAAANSAAAAAPFPPNFPPIRPHPTQNLMNSIAESGFGLGGLGKRSSGGPPSSASTPPAASSQPTRSPPTSSNIRSPSSEFTSQQNWSFEEQFKQVREQ